jgi:nucleotide-binding universal stress UspA family protein
MRSILVPVDGSARDARAVKAALRDGTGTRIELLNVQPLFHRHIADRLPRAAIAAWRAERSGAILERARSQVQAAGASCAIHAVAGPVTRCIVEHAKRLGVDEIVLSATRRGPIGRLLANSVSTRLLEASPIPVRVVPAEAKPMLDRLALPAGLGLVALLLLVEE